MKTSDIFMGMWDAITPPSPEMYEKTMISKDGCRELLSKQKLNIKSEMQTSQRPPGKLQTHSFLQ